EIEREEYALEYGTDLLEVHRDAVEPGERVAVVDDVLATGGTAAATVRLVERLGAVVVGLGLVVELAFLDGRRTLGDLDVLSLITYEETRGHRRPRAPLAAAAGVRRARAPAGDLPRHAPAG